MSPSCPDCAYAVSAMLATCPKCGCAFRPVRLWSFKVAIGGLSLIASLALVTILMGWH